MEELTDASLQLLDARPLGLTLSLVLWSQMLDEHTPLAVLSSLPSFHSFEEL